MDGAWANDLVQLPDLLNTYSSGTCSRFRVLIFQVSALFSGCSALGN
jgi:hypothetical protein